MHVLYKATKENEVIPPLTPLDGVYVVHCKERQNNFDAVVVNVIGKQVFFIQTSKSKHADHSKPKSNYCDDVVTTLERMYESKFTSFFVYATTNMQNYTRPKEGNVYFMELNKVLHRAIGRS